jgi:hypothetical protein
MQLFNLVCPLEPFCIMPSLLLALSILFCPLLIISNPAPSDCLSCQNLHVLLILSDPICPVDPVLCNLSCGFCLIPSVLLVLFNPAWPHILCNLISALVLSVLLVLLNIYCLKGQCHEIFDPRFFSSKHPSWAPD